MKNKVVIIGLDGATLDLIKPWANKGLLPNIRKLMSDGTHGPLKSVHPHCTASAWASFATGKNPGKHGCYDFLVPKSSLGNLRAVTSHDIKTETFYEVIERKGLRYILINLPVSYPCRTNNPENVVITSLLTQGDNFFFPNSLIEQLPELRNYRISPSPRIRVEGTTDQYVHDIRELEKVRFECAKNLFQNREWDLFFYLISGTDWIQHRMFKKLISGEVNQTKEVVQAYQDFDRYIGWFVDHLPKRTSFLIISDHGFTVRKKMFYLNTFLFHEGYLSIAKKPTLRVAATPRIAAHQAENKNKIELPEGIAGIIRNPSEKFKKFLKRNTFLLNMMRFLYWKVVKKFISLESNWNVGGVNIPNSRAYMTWEGIWGIYINDSDRFQDGLVRSRKEYERLRLEIRDKLIALKDSKTKKPIFDWVALKEEIYHGDYMLEAPDILFESSTQQVDSIITREATRTVSHNGHSPYGLLIAWGPGIKKGKNITGATIMDVAPTVLHLLGLPIFDDMDGKMLKDLFEVDSEPFKSVPNKIKSRYYETGRSKKEEDEGVKARLRDLGYL